MTLGSRLTDFRQSQASRQIKSSTSLIVCKRGMQSLTLQLPVCRDCLCHNTLHQQVPYLTSARALRRAARTRRHPIHIRPAAKWNRNDSPPEVAVKALEQNDTTSRREKGDTAYIAKQQAATRTRLQQLFTTQYDQEICAILFPALLAIFLDPVMILVDTGALTATSACLSALQSACMHTKTMLAMLPAPILPS